MVAKCFGHLPCGQDSAGGRKKKQEREKERNKVDAFTSPMRGAVGSSSGTVGASGSSPRRVPNCSVSGLFWATQGSFNRVSWQLPTIVQTVEPTGLMPLHPRVGLSLSTFCAKTKVLHVLAVTQLPEFVVSTLIRMCYTWWRSFSLPHPQWVVR